MSKFEKHNAEAVLENVEKRLAEINTQYRKRYSMREVCDELSIFDWWVDYLSEAKLKDMRKFLRVAIERGYTGYVCFKVGAKGCANGMWAHKAESETGYSPDGEFLYKSFTPSYNYWSVVAADGKTYPSHDTDDWDSCKTIKQLDQLLAEVVA